MENKNFTNLNSNCLESNEYVKNTNDQVVTSHQTNISAEEIDEETIAKLRGDAIGETMYSQSSVIKILLQLSDINWDERLEQDLCYLWDMTVEKDVGEYLFQLSFPSIATAIILRYSEPRLIEIIIGILANIYSNSEDPPDISDDEIGIVLNAMDTEDHLILIQIMRFITAIVYHRNNKLSFITNEVMEKISFILTNSMNKELLLNTMVALAKITADFKMESNLLNSNVVNSVLIAYDLINKREEYDQFDEESEEEMKSLNSFLQIILNVCLYLNETNDDTLFREIKNEELVLKFQKIIKKFCREGYLIPLSEEITFYFDSFTIIFPVLSVRYDRDIFINILNIIGILMDNKVDKINEFIELSRYIVSVISDVDSIVKEIKYMRYNNVLKCILEHDSKCEFSYKEKLSMIIQKIEENVNI